jgi:hypothetical protein
MMHDKLTGRRDVDVELDAIGPSSDRFPKSGQGILGKLT